MFTSCLKSIGPSAPKDGSGLSRFELVPCAVAVSAPCNGSISEATVDGWVVEGGRIS